MAITIRDQDSHEQIDDSPTDEVRALSAGDLERLAATAMVNGTADAGPDVPSATPGPTGVAERVQSLQRVESEIHQLLAHWADIEKGLTAKSAEIEKLTALLASRQAEVDRLDHALADEIRERDGARAEVQRLESELTRQQGTSAEAEERIKVLLGELQGLRDASARLEQDVSDREAARLQTLGELDRYRDALLGMEQTIARNEKAVVRRENEKAALAATIAGLEERMAALDGRREDSEAANVKLQALLAQGQREIARLSEELRQEQETRERLAADLQARDQQLAELRGELSSANAAIAAQREEMESNAAAAEETRRELEAKTHARIEELTLSLRAEKATSGQLAEDLGQRNQRITDLQNALVAECDNAEAARLRVAAAEEALAARLAAATARHEELRLQLAGTQALEQRLAASEQERDGARRELATLGARLKATDAEMEARDHRIAELEAFSLGHVEALAASKMQLLAATRTRDELQSQISERDREIAGLLASIEDAKTGRDDLESELAAQHKVIEGLEARLHANRETIAALDAEARRLAEIETHVQKLDARMTEQLVAKPATEARANGADSANGKRAARTARLLVSLQGDRPIEFPLYKDIMVIGRGRDADIHISGDFASRRHARICAKGEQVFIEDLGSMNGISVNSKPVTRQLLHDGDVLEIGGSQLRFVDPGEHASPSRTPETAAACAEDVV